MRAGLSCALLAFIPLLAGCHNNADRNRDRIQAASFNNRFRCAQLAQSGNWENSAEGPFLDQIYYSPSLNTCVFVMKQSFPADKDGEVRNLAQIVDGLSRKQIWANDPKVGQTEEQVNSDVEQQLTKLQVVR
jgi:hypothetical protein